MSDITEKVTDEVVPEAVTDTADSTAEPEAEPEGTTEEHHSDEPWKAPVNALEEKVTELAATVAGLTAVVPAPTVETPDESHADTTPVRKPWTSRGLRRRNVIE